MADAALTFPPDHSVGAGHNRGAIDAVLRYHYEQRLAKRRLRREDIFVPSLLNT